MPNRLISDMREKDVLLSKEGRLIDTESTYIKMNARMRDDSIDVLTIRDGSTKLAEFYDNKEYTHKLERIMESVTVKTELGETVLWHHRVKGFFGGTKRDWLITNYRVIFIDYKANQVLQLPLKYVDVVVMNARSDYQSEGVGVFVGVPASIASGMGFLRRQGSSRRIGDLVFLLNGQILLAFCNVLDPSGVKRLIEQVKRQLYGKEK